MVYCVRLLSNMISDFYLRTSILWFAFVIDSYLMSGQVFYGLPCVRFLMSELMLVPCVRFSSNVRTILWFDLC